MNALCLAISTAVSVSNFPLKSAILIFLYKVNCYLSQGEIVLNKEIVFLWCFR